MSVRFLAAADPDGAIVRGVRRRERSIDFKSPNDAGLEGLRDPEVLELAATEGRLLVSKGTRTMPVHFAARSHLRLKNPGVLLALQTADAGDVIESLLIIWASSREEERADQIHCLPSLSRHVFR